MKKKYTNIIHLFYDGDLKKCVTQMEISDDTTDMSEDMLLDRHMKLLKKLHSDSLIIIDNFNVLPKEDAFFKEFIKLNCKILITSRCNISQYETLKVSEMDADTELVKLFYKHCPSAKDSEDVVKDIIQTVGCHTLTVCLSALSLTANGMEPEELLAELRTCGLNISSGEDVELYKDGDFTDGLMIEHLRRLLQLGKLSNQQLDILRNLSLLPVAGMIKTMKFRKDRMAKSAMNGFTNATDAADYLVGKGVPFRDAHGIIGRLVLYCIEKDTSIDALSLEELRSISDKFDEDIYDAISLKTCVEKRLTIGAPGAEMMKQVIEKNKEYLKTNAIEVYQQSLEDRIQ